MKCLLKVDPWFSVVFGLFCISPTFPQALARWAAGVQPLRALQGPVPSVTRLGGGNQARLCARYSQEHRGVAALPAQMVGKRNQEATEGGKQRRDVLCAPRFLRKRHQIPSHSRGRCKPWGHYLWNTRCAAPRSSQMDMMSCDYSCRWTYQRLRVTQKPCLLMYKHGFFFNVLILFYLNSMNWHTVYY